MRKLLFLLVISALFYVGCEQAGAVTTKPEPPKPPKPKVYTIYTSEGNFTTNYYKKDSLGCVHFKTVENDCICGSESKTYEACGTYVIEEIQPK